MFGCKAILAVDSKNHVINWSDKDSDIDEYLPTKNMVINKIRLEVMRILKGLKLCYI